MSALLSIAGIGAISAVGANALQTSTSIRAGLARFREHETLETLATDPESQSGSPLLAAPCAGMNRADEGPERLTGLAIRALEDLTRTTGLDRADLSRTALLVALPVLDEAVRTWTLATSFIPRIRSAIGLAREGTQHLNHSGHTGIFELMNEAHRMLNSGECRFCLLLGVDSYLSADRVAVWDAGWRLRSERSPDGFMPGEAASVMLLELPATASARGSGTRASVGAIGMAKEPRAFDSERASTGSGLCGALRAIVPQRTKVEWVCCDLNGEGHRAFEWGLARSRLHESIDPSHTLEHPADCIGDVGAATGGILAAVAIHRLEGGNPRASPAYLWTASDNGSRAAIRIDAA